MEHSRLSGNPYYEARAKKLRYFIFGVLAACSFAAAPDDPGGMIRELSAIERRGVDLEHLSLQEALRDSNEAKAVNSLRRQIARVAKIAVPFLIEAVLDSQRSTTLKLLLDVLADLGPPGVPEPIAGMLASQKTDVVLRRQIPRFIGRLGNASHVALLEKIASTETDYALCKEAVDALGALRERAGVPALYRQLDAKSSVARSAAAEVMGEIDEYPAVPLLIDRLLDPDPYVRTFAQASLTELTYRYAPNRPLDLAGQQTDWRTWWQARKSRPRAELLRETIRECLGVLSEKNSRAAWARASWLAELSFQMPPNEALFESPLAPALQAMEAVRWSEWSKAHASEGRLEWFREAIDLAIQRLGQTDPAASWLGLSVLSELIALPAGEPYLFRAVWVREAAETRRQLAEVYAGWWKSRRSTFLPLGKKYW